MIGDTIAVAIIGLVGALIVAWLTALHARLRRVEAENRALWLWARQLVHHIYTGEGPPPPAAPASLTTD